jgi:hypothetical protein
MLQWWVRQTAEVENTMTSVERLVEYTELPQEEPRWEKETRGGKTVAGRAGDCPDLWDGWGGEWDGSI